MPTHLENDLDYIKSKIFEMADLAMEAIAGSMKSLKEADHDLAKEVIANDSVLDRLEVAIDDQCIRVLATRQPAASCLRFVLAVLKITTDLERIGDLATNIAEEVLGLNARMTLKPLGSVMEMAEIGTDMIKDSFESLADHDAEKAGAVIRRDDIIDDMNIRIFRELFSVMSENPGSISHALGLITIARHLERIADHATNIAEKAIYYIEGIDVRHPDE